MSDKKIKRGQIVYVVTEDYDKTTYVVEGKYYGTLDNGKYLLENSEIVELPNSKTITTQYRCIYETLEDALYSSEKNNRAIAKEFLRKYEDTDKEYKEVSKRLSSLEADMALIEDWAEKRIYKPFNLTPN